MADNIFDDDAMTDTAVPTAVSSHIQAPENFFDETDGEPPARPGANETIIPKSTPAPTPGWQQGLIDGVSVGTAREAARSRTQSERLFPRQETPEEASFWGAVEHGLGPQNIEALAGTLDFLGDATGDKAFAGWSREMRDSLEKDKSSYKAVFESFKQIRGLTDAWGYVKERAGQMVGPMLPSIAMGTAGAVIGGLEGGTYGKYGAAIGGTAGGVLGAASGTLHLHISDMRQALVREGVSGEDLTKFTAYGAAALVSLDAMFPAAQAMKLAGTARRGLSDKVAQQMIKNLAAGGKMRTVAEFTKAFGKDLIRDVIKYEVTTELAQQAITDLGAKKLAGKEITQADVTKFATETAPEVAISTIIGAGFMGIPGSAVKGFKDVRDAKAGVELPGDKPPSNAEVAEELGAPPPAPITGTPAVEEAATSQPQSEDPSQDLTPKPAEGAQGVSVLQFIRSQGGMMPSGELDALDAHRYPGLINQGGKSADAMREALVDAGYLEESGPDQPSVTTPADVYGLVQRAISGERIVPLADAQADSDGLAAQNTKNPIKELEHAEKQFVLPEIERYDEELGDPIVSQTYKKLAADERMEVIDRTRRGEDAADVIEEIAMRNVDSEAVQALILARGPDPELAARIRAMVAEQQPDLLNAFDDLAGQFPVRRPPVRRDPAPKINEEPSPVALGLGARLKEVASDQPAFDAAIVEMERDRKLSKEDARQIAADYLGKPPKPGSRASYFQAVRNAQGGRDVIAGSAGMDQLKGGTLPDRPAVPVQQSILPGAIVSLIDGTKHADIRAHLKSQNIAIEDYQRNFQLGDDYLLVAPNAIAQRHEPAREKMDYDSFEKQFTIGGVKQAALEAAAKAAPAAAQGATLPAAAPKRDLSAEFTALLAGKTPRARWGQALGLADKQLAPLIERAVEGGLLVRDARGVARRAPNIRDSFAPDQVLAELQSALAEPAQTRATDAGLDLPTPKSVRSRASQVAALTDRLAAMPASDAIRIAETLLGRPLGPAEKRSRAQVVGAVKAYVREVAETATKALKAPAGTEALILPGQIGGENVTLTPKALSKVAQLQAVAEKAVAKILPRDVRIEVVDNIKIARLAREDELLSLAAAEAATRTPGFRLWFDGSKVVGESGQPLRVYHGTTAPALEQFELTKFGAGNTEVAFFTDKPFVADEYNQSIYGATGGATYPVYLSIKNPLIVDLKTRPKLFDVPNEFYAGANAKAFAEAAKLSASRHKQLFGRSDIQRLLEKYDTAEKWRDFVEDVGFSDSGDRDAAAYGRLSEDEQAALYDAAAGTKGISDLFAEAKQKGHDGVILKNVVDTPGHTLQNQYIAFASTQIKSVFNRGTFDPSDPRISYSLRSSKSAKVPEGTEGEADELQGDSEGSGQEGNDASRSSGAGAIAAAVGGGGASGASSAEGRILRQESATLRADGSIRAGRVSTAGDASRGGLDAEALQSVGTSEFFDAPGLRGVVTAIPVANHAGLAERRAPASEYRLANLVYRIYDAAAPIAPEHLKHDEGGRFSGRVRAGGEIHIPLIWARISQHMDGTWEVSSVDRLADAQAAPRGMAAKLYAAIEKDLGIRMSPSGYLSPDGYAMWQKRSPASVQWHQKSKSEQDFYISPRRIKDRLPEVGKQIEFFASRMAENPGDPQVKKDWDGARAERKELITLWGKLPLEARGATPNTMFSLRSEPEAIEQVRPQALGQTDPVGQIISIGARAVEEEARVTGKSMAKITAQVARHEALEFLLDKGFIQPKEWAVLTEAATREGWVAEMGVSDAYAELYKGMAPAELDALILKESIMEKFARYERGQYQPTGVIAQVFQRIAAFFASLREGLKGNGFQTWEDIFQKIDAGELRRRYEAIYGSQGAATADVAPQAMIAGGEQQRLMTQAAWSGTQQTFSDLLGDDLVRGRKHFEGAALLAFDSMAKNMRAVVVAVTNGNGDAARAALASALANASEMERQAPGARTNLYTQYVRQAARAQSAPQPMIRAGQLPDARGIAQTPGQQSPAGATPMRGISELIEDARRAMGLPHRTGRLDPALRRAARQAGGELLGQYNGVARTQIGNDIDVFSHEAGHHLERVLGGDLTNIINAQAAELTPLGPGYGNALSEGFAEFFRRYVTNPTSALQHAPNFYRDFEDLLDATNPALARTLENVQQEYDRFLLGDPIERGVAQQTVLRRPGGAVAATRRFLADAERDGYVSTMADRLYDLHHGFIQSVFDKQHGWWMATRALLNDIEARSGRRVSLQAATNPFKLMKLASHTQAWAQQDLKHGIALRSRPNGGGVSLHQVLATAFGGTATNQWHERRLAEFGDYLVARRAVHQYVRYRPQFRQAVQQFVAANPQLSFLLPRLPQNIIAEIENPPTAEPLFEHLNRLVEHERRNPQFRQAAELYYQFNRDMITLLHEKGLITDAERTEYHGDRDYAPFQRDMSDRDLADGGKMESRRPGRKRDQANKHDVYRAFNGSMRDIINPIQSTIQTVFEVRLRAAINDTLAAMDTLARQAGPAGNEIFERIPPNEARAMEVSIRESLRAAARAAGMSPTDTAIMLTNVETQIGQNAVVSLFTQQQTSEKGEKIVWFFEKGRPVPAVLADGALGNMMFEGLTAVGRRNMGMLIEAMTLTAATVRTGVTFSPAFILRNIWVDAISAPVNSPHARPFTTQVSGMREIFNSGQYLHMYNRYAGMLGGAAHASIADQTVDRDIEMLRQTGFNVRRPRSLRELLSMVFRLGEFSETATRVGIFRNAMRSAVADGMTPFDAAIEAGHYAHDVMDFSQHGSKTETLRRIIPFFNAALQGMYRYGKTLTAANDYGNLIQIYQRHQAGQPLSRNEQLALGQAYRAWMYSTVVFGGMSLIFCALGADDEDMKEVPDSIRATNWRISIDGILYLLPKNIASFIAGEDGKADWLGRLPKNFEMAWFANGVERAWDYFVNHDPAAARRMASDMFTVTMPPHSPPSLDLAYGFLSGKDLYSGNDIVPIWEKGKNETERKEQFGPYTSQVGKSLGEALNISPYYADFLVRNLFASVGQDVTTAVDMLSGKGPLPEIGEYPVARRFSYNTGKASASLQTFYNMVTDNEGLTRWFWDTVSDDARSFSSAANTYKDLKDKGGENAIEANAYLGRVNPDQQVFAVLSVDFEKRKSKLRNLHPIINASEGISTVNALMKEVTDGTLMMGKEEEKQQMSRDEMRFARNELGHVRKGFAQNSLKILGIEGWASQPLMDVDARLATLKAGAPKVHAELMRRMEKKDIQAFSHVAKVWPEVRKRVLANRKEAQLSDLADGKVEAY